MKNIRVFIWLLLMLLAFVLDIFTTLGYTVFFLYIGILFLFIYSGKKQIIFAGSASIVFILIGFLLSPNYYHIPLEMIITNHALGILMVLFFMFGMIKYSANRRILLKKVHELEAANKELESFNFISSHDLQEPLRKIQNYVSVLNKEKNVSDEGKGFLAELNQTSLQMRSLIDDLSRYSRIKKKNLRFEKVSVSKIIDRVFSSLKANLDEKNATIKIDGDCEACLVPDLFTQVLVNLIDNSLKFSHPDRPLSIQIKIKVVHVSKSELKVLPHLDYCHITFTDNGIGFDPQYNERVFDFFERLNGHEYPGTGLGLSICRKIVESHDGRITAIGKPDQGVHFDIYIPLKRN